MTLPNTAIANPESILLKSVKQAVLIRQYDKLAGIFTQFFDNRALVPALKEVWQALDYLQKPTINLRNIARQLAVLVLDFLQAGKEYEPALNHIRNTRGLFEPNRETRQLVIGLYKRLYADTPHLENFFRISGIDHISESFEFSIERLDKLIGLSIHAPIYSSRYGYGEVLKFDFVLDSVTLNFFSSPGQTITLEQAIKSLQVLPADNFFYLKAKNPARLAQFIKDNPHELTRIINRDISPLPKPGELKQLLSAIIDDESVKTFVKLLTARNGFRERVVSTKPTVPTKTNQQTGLGLSELKALKQKSDWQTQYTDLFLTASNKKLFTVILSELEPAKRAKLIERVVIEYRTYPDQFLYICQTALANTGFSLNALLTRLLDLAQTKRYAPALRNFVIKNDFSLLKDLLSAEPVPRCEKLFESLQAVKNFYPEELEQIRQIFAQRFPEKFGDKIEFVYHSQTAIINKTKELENLLAVEIPKVASEIALARGLGDLRENFEFKAAKEKQKRLMAKVAQIRKDLLRARPIDFNAIDTKQVMVGTTVKLVLLPDRSESLSYSILGPWDSDVSKAVISYLAPFAQNLSGKKVGDEITDAEGKKYEISEISVSNASLISSL